MLTASPQYAARKVKLAKWQKAADSNDAALIEDATRSDLTDESGILSFWECDGTPQSITRVIIAIASAHIHLESTAVVWAPVADLAAIANSVNPSNGRTPFADMADSHLDVQVDREQVKLIAAIFLEAVNAGRYRQMPRSRIAHGIAAAVSDGSIAMDDLSPGVQRRIRALLEN